MITWMNPQQYQQWMTRAAAPTGWKGTWPPTAPNGPPQLPQGMKIDPKMWYSGQWQFNPSYRAIPSVQAQVWAPHPMWQQSQHAADFNPYKRKPNPGDAAYWATKLSDNPLQLHNMHIRSADPTAKQAQPSDGDSTELPQTPWVWAPRSLSRSPEPHDPQRDAHAGHGVRDAQVAPHSQQQQQTSEQQPIQQQAPQQAPRSQSQPRQQQPSQQVTQPAHQSRGVHKLTGGLIAILRSKHDWSAEDQQKHKSRQAKMQASHGADAVRDDHRRRWEDVKAYWDLAEVTWALTESQMYFLYEEMEKETALSRRHQRQQSGTPAPPPLSSTSQQHSSQPRDIRPPHSAVLSSASSVASSAPASSRSGFQEQQARALQERVPGPVALERRTSEDSSAFTGRNQQLQPTFSPSIIRIPQHYTSSASAAAAAPNASSSGPTPPRTSLERTSPPRSHGPIYGPPTPRNSTPSRSSTESSSTYSTPSRQSSTASAQSSHSKTTAGPSPLSHLPTFSDEPASGLLSPLVTGSSSERAPILERSRSGRELGRSQTVPYFASDTTFDSIPEERAPFSASSRTPRPSPHHPSYQSYRDDTGTPTPSSRRSPGDPRTLGRSQTMPTLDHPSSSGSRRNSPSSSPNYLRTRSPSRNSPTKSRAASPLRNPLPPPPVPSSYPISSTSAAFAAMSMNGASRSYSQPQPQPHSRDHPDYPSSTSRAQSLPSAHSSHSAYSSRTTAMSTASSSASSAAAAAAAARAAQQARQEAQAERRPVRRGFWNRRGDYLWLPPNHDRSNQQFIVYAPRELANPPELQDYPLPTQGFMNHHRETIKYDGSIPELPESLPVHGEPPLRPYETFVRYVDE